jgi:hypothetical protein
VPPEPIAVAREPAAAAVPLPPVEAEAPPPAVDAAPAAAAGQSPQSLDEMAAHLYDRIRSRLRDELLVDRERAGLVTDVR